MKIAVHIVRTLLAAMFLFASISFFFHLGGDPPPQTGNMKIFNEGLMASGYLLTLAKVVELVCGILLIINLFAPLANVVLFPVTLNIMFIHAFMSPKELPMMIVLVLFHLFLAYAYRKNYAGLFSFKPVL